jgi:hypothetical protein
VDHREMKIGERNNLKSNSRKHPTTEGHVFPD